MTFVAEVAPAAPLLPPLLALIGCAVALGLVYSAHQLVSALFSVGQTVLGETLGRIPWLGGKVLAPLHRIEQRVNNYLTKIVTGLEGAVADSWHNLANAAVFMGRAIVATAEAAWRVGWYVEVKFPLKVISALAHRGVRGAQALWRQIEAQRVRVQTVVRVIERPTGGPIAAGVKAGTRAIVGELQGVERWIGTKGRVAYREATVDLPRDIAGLRARDLSLGRLYERLRKRLAKLDKLTVGTAFAGAVAIALSRLGAGWIRCSNWNRIGRTVCRSPFTDIEGLLALLVAEQAIRDLPGLVRELQLVTHETVRGIQRIAQV